MTHPPERLLDPARLVTDDTLILIESGQISRPSITKPWKEIQAMYQDENSTDIFLRNLIEGYGNASMDGFVFSIAPTAQASEVEG